MSALDPAEEFSTIEVCPECGSTGIRILSGGQRSTRSEDDDGSYRCGAPACRVEFDEPATRPSKIRQTERSGVSHPAALQLLDMDPEDWGAPFEVLFRRYGLGDHGQDDQEPEP